MYYVALRMLIGDTTKFLALVFGLTFSTTLIVQQGSIFTGIMRRTAANVERLPQVDIWVMHPATQYYEERKAIETTALNRVRGVNGVDWAERMYVGVGTAKLPEDVVNGYKWELYNLAEDQSQKDNLAAKRPEEVKELAALLKKVSARDDDAKVK